MSNISIIHCCVYKKNKTLVYTANLQKYHTYTLKYIGHIVFHYTSVYSNVCIVPIHPIHQYTPNYASGVLLSISCVNYTYIHLILECILNSLHVAKNHNCYSIHDTYAWLLKSVHAEERHEAKANIWLSLECSDNAYSQEW